MNKVEPKGTTLKSRHDLVEEFKFDLNCGDYSTEELIAMHEDQDLHEFVDGHISVYYAGLIEQCNELTGEEWSQVWLNPTELEINNVSAHDTLAGNLYLLYYEIANESLELLIQDIKQEEE